MTKECRICYEEESAENILISPCLCDGTSKYVHQNCLEMWRLCCDNPDGEKKCMECRAEYAIIKKFPLEIYKIQFLIESSGRIFIEWLFINACLVLLSVIPSSSTNFELIGDKRLKDILNRDINLHFLYYYSLISLFATFFCHIAFIKKINEKVHRKKLYYSLNWYEYVPLFISTLHFFWLYLLIGLASDSYDVFIFMESGFTFLNPLFFSLIYKTHNKTLSFMNTELNYDIIGNFQENIVVL